MKLTDKTKLVIAWTGALIMQVIFLSMMLTDQMEIERYYRLQQRQPVTRAKVVRMPNRNHKKQILVAK
jgi:hypothetical protein